MKVIKVCMILFLLVSAGQVYSQRGKHHGHPGGRHPHKPHKVMVVKHSRYRPHKTIVYHPHWHPARAYNRRWVFFPRHNMYWDNWRNHYVFYTGTIWVSQPAPPPSVNKTELEKENQKELPEEEDDVDDVYKSNDKHKKETDTY